MVRELNKLTWEQLVIFAVQKTLLLLFIAHVAFMLPGNICLICRIKKCIEILFGNTDAIRTTQKTQCFSYIKKDQNNKELLLTQANMFASQGRRRSLI